MNAVVFTFAVYLPISLAVTIWVARTLHKNGRIFLVDAFHQNQELADSVNHLLVVGFYLINIGFVTYAWRFGVKPGTVEQALDFLAGKLGLVLLILGGMHFFNLYLFNRFRRHATLQDSPPPVMPTETI